MFNVQGCRLLVKLKGFHLFLGFIKYDWKSFLIGAIDLGDYGIKCFFSQTLDEFWRSSPGPKGLFLKFFNNYKMIS